MLSLGLHSAPCSLHSSLTHSNPHRASLSLKWQQRKHWNTGEPKSASLSSTALYIHLRQHSLWHIQVKMFFCFVLFFFFISRYKISYFKYYNCKLFKINDHQIGRQYKIISNKHIINVIYIFMVGKAWKQNLSDFHFQFISLKENSDIFLNWYCWISGLWCQWNMNSVVTDGEHAV